MTEFTSLSFSTDELAKFIKSFVKGTELDTSAALQYVTREVGIRVVARTPIDTQRAVAGWSAAGRNLNFDVPSSQYSQAGDSSYRQRLTGSNQYIEFTNNVPYIIYLEYGWSKQAPLGMMRISVAEVKASGVLPALLAKSYKRRWEGEAGVDRYDLQESIMSRGLAKVKTKVPSRRSIAAHLSAELRKRRAGHKTSAVLTAIQNKFREKK